MNESNNNQNFNDIFSQPLDNNNPSEPVNPVPVVESPIEPEYVNAKEDTVEIIPEPVNIPIIEEQPAQPVFTFNPNEFNQVNPVPTVDPVEEPIMIDPTQNVEVDTIEIQPEEVVPVPTVDPINPVPIVDIDSEKVNESVEMPTNGFAEMQVAGIDHNKVESKIAPLMSTNDEAVEHEAFTTGTPTTKVNDENSGLKYLLVIGIILVVVIILLPYL